MKSIHLLLFAILIAIIGHSCKTKKTEQIGTPLTITPTAPENFISDLTPYIDSISLIPIEVSDQSLISFVSKILILPNGNFIVNTHRLLMFNPAGQYLFSLGQQGRGHEEYNGVVDFCISRDNKEVWILTNTEEIVGYNIENQKFIRKIKPSKAEINSNFEAIASGYDDSFFLFVTSYTDTNNEQKTNNLLHINANGKLLHSYLPQQDYIVNMGLMTQSYDNQYILRPQNADNICYHLKDSIPVPRVKIDFGTKTAPNLLSPDIQTYLQSDYYKMPIFIHETAEQFFFTYCGPKAQEHYCIHSFANNKTITWQRTGNDSNALFQIYCSDHDFFYGIYNDYRSSDDMPMQEIDLLKRAIIEKTNIQLPEDSNPYLVKIKFKL